MIGKIDFEPTMKTLTLSLIPGLIFAVIASSLWNGLTLVEFALLVINGTLLSSIAARVIARNNPLASGEGYIPTLK